MAKFLLELLTNHIQEKNNQFYSYFLRTPITTFSSKQKQSCDYTGISHISYGYSFNETYSEQLNSQKELSFKMLYHILEGQEILENPFMKELAVGSLILLTDKFGNETLFTITEVQHELQEENATFTYKCQDAFTYQAIRQSQGYTIHNDIKDADFLGSHNLDYWANKIKKECSLTYEYIPLEETFYSIKTAYKMPEDFIFKINNQNADAALIELAKYLELNLKVYERLDEKGVLQGYFWFEPQKNQTLTGLKYSPYREIENFSFGNSGNILTSVLNVTNKIDKEHNISLIPKIPANFFDIMQQPKWNDKYYPGFYSDLFQLANKDKLTRDEQEFVEIADQCPWLENKIFNFDYFLEHNLISVGDYNLLQDMLQNQLRKVNAKVLWITRAYQGAITENNKKVQELTAQLDKLGAELNSSIVNSFEKRDMPVESIEFNKLYNELFFTSYSRIPLVNYSEVVNQSINKVFNMHQLFLKNLYDFRKYFNTELDLQGKKLGLWTFSNLSSVDSARYQLEIHNPQLKKLESFQSIDYNNLYDWNTEEKLELITDQDFIDKKVYAWTNVDYLLDTKYDSTKKYYVHTYKVAVKAIENYKDFSFSKDDTFAELQKVSQEYVWFRLPWNQEPLANFHLYGKTISGSWVEISGIDEYLEMTASDWEKASSKKKLATPYVPINRLQLNEEEKTLISYFNTKTFSGQYYQGLPLRQVFVKDYNIVIANMSRRKEILNSKGESFLDYCNYVNQLTEKEVAKPKEKWFSFPFVVENFEDVFGLKQGYQQKVIQCGSLYAGQIMTDTVTQLVDPTVAPRRNSTPATHDLKGNVLEAASHPDFVWTPKADDYLSYVLGAADKHTYECKEYRQLNEYYTYNIHTLERIAQTTPVTYEIDFNARHYYNFYSHMAADWKFTLKDDVENQKIYYKTSYLYSVKANTDIDKKIPIKKYWKVDLSKLTEQSHWAAFNSRKMPYDSIIFYLFEKLGEPVSKKDILLTTPDNIMYLAESDYLVDEALDARPEDNARYHIFDLDDIAKKCFYYQTDNYRSITKEDAEQHLDWKLYLEKDGFKKRGIVKGTSLEKIDYEVASLKNTPWTIDLIYDPAITSISVELPIKLIDTQEKNETILGPYPFTIDLNTPNTEIRYVDKNGLVFTGNINVDIGQEQTLFDNNKTNGWFWINNYNNIDNPTLQTKALEIEAELSRLWSNAYQASLRINYFLPPVWQIERGTNINAYAGLLFKMTLDTATNKPFYSNIEILNTFIPDISLQEEKYNYKIQLKNSTEEKGIAWSASSWNDSLKELEKDLKLDTNDWEIVRKETSEKVAYYSISDGGTTWGEFLSPKFFQDIRYELFSGWDILFFRIYFNHYLEDKNGLKQQYQNILQTKENLWKKIYELFPNILIESSFNNDKVNSSLDLYKSAIRYMKDISEPENSYDVSLIDINSLKGYHGQEIRIGDGILLDLNAYLQFPQILSSLNKILYINNISYDLRNDSSIKLAVNTVRYRDKILERLVDLI